MNESFNYLPAPAIQAFTQLYPVGAEHGVRPYLGLGCN